MSKAVLLFLVTSVAFGLTTLHLVSELRTERATVQELQTRIAQLERGAAPAPMTAPPIAAPAEEAAVAVEAQPTAEKAQATAVRRTVGSLNVFSATSIGAVDPPSHEEHERMFRQHLERQRKLLKDPQYRQAMIIQHKMSQRQMHPELAQELGLTAQQADQLLTLLAEQQLRGMDNASFGPAPAAISSHDVQEMQNKFQQQQQANEAELRNLLGDAKMQVWKEYQSTLGVRHEVTQLRNTLASRGVPLDRELAKPLLQIMAEEQQQFFRDSERRFAQIGVSDASAGNLMTQVELQERHFEQIAQRYQHQRDALSNLLTAEQLKVLEEEHSAHMQMQRAHLQMMRAQAEAEARGEVAPTAMGTADAIVVH